jgi:hypothetical protein
MRSSPKYLKLQTPKFMKLTDVRQPKLENERQTRAFSADGERILIKLAGLTARTIPSQSRSARPTSRRVAGR